MELGCAALPHPVPCCHRQHVPHPHSLLTEPLGTSQDGRSPETLIRGTVTLNLSAFWFWQKQGSKLLVLSHKSVQPSAPVQLLVCVLLNHGLFGLEHFFDLSGIQESEHLQPWPCLCSQAAVWITDGILVLHSAVGLSLGQATPLLSHGPPELLCFPARWVQSFI